MHLKASADDIYWNGSADDPFDAIDHAIEQGEYLEAIARALRIIAVASAAAGPR